MTGEEILKEEGGTHLFKYSIEVRESTKGKRSSTIKIRADTKEEAKELLNNAEDIVREFKEKNEKVEG